MGVPEWAALIGLAVYAIGIGVAYGKINQRVGTMETTVSKCSNARPDGRTLFMLRSECDDVKNRLISTVEEIKISVNKIAEAQQDEAKQLAALGQWVKDERDRRKEATG